MSGEKTKLKPKIGQLAMLAMAVGIIVGPWMPQMPFWFSLTGPSVALGFVIITILVIPIIFAYAELTAMLPFAGGEYNFTRNALGYTPAWITGWFLILLYLIATGFMGPATARMGQALFMADISDMTVAIWGVVILFGFSVLNTYSMGVSVRIQLIMVFAMVAVGICTTMWFFGSGHWTIANLTPFFSTGYNGFLVAVGILVCMVIGFDCIPQMAEEANFPRERLLTIMIASVVISELLFALICFAVAGMKPTTWIVEQIIVDPEIARELAGSIPAAIINIAGLCATLTCLNGFMISASRVVFAMGRSRVLPPVFAKTNKHDIPYVAVWFVFIVCSLMIFFGGESWLETLFIAAAFATGIIYTLTAISAVVLRYKHPDWNRPIKMPGGAAMGVLATIIGIGITITVAVGMPTKSWVLFAVWIIIGLVVFIWMGSIRQKDENFKEVYFTPDDIEENI